MEELTKEARRICGCTQCHGGYDIGARTLGIPAGDILNAELDRPTSCVAGVLLADMLARQPKGKVGKPDPTPIPPGISSP